MLKCRIPPTYRDSMSIDNLYAVIRSFMLNNQLIALGILICLVLFLWKKPWEFFKIAAAIAALLAGFYVFTQLGQSANFGSQKKHDITTERTEKMFGE